MDGNGAKGNNEESGPCTPLRTFGDGLVLRKPHLTAYDLYKAVSVSGAVPLMRDSAWFERRGQRCRTSVRTIEYACDYRPLPNRGLNQ